MVKIDMDMPKGCKDCMFVIYTEGFDKCEYLFCPTSGSDVTSYNCENEGIHPDCPLIEIEEGE